VANTGYHIPGTIVEQDYAGGVRPWANESDAASSNNAYATSAGLRNPGISEWLKCTNFSMGVPAGATIDGIIVRIERKASAGGANLDEIVQLVKGGSFVGNNKATATFYTTSDVVVYYGGASDKWGTTWSVAQVNASDFGIGFVTDMDSQTTTYVDMINIIVYYTPAAVGTDMKINVGGVWKDVAEVKVNVSGVWKNVTEAWINVAGVWKQVFGP